MCSLLQVSRRTEGTRVIYLRENFQCYLSDFSRIIDIPVFLKYSRVTVETVMLSDRTATAVAARSRFFLDFS